MSSVNLTLVSGSNQADNLAAANEPGINPAQPWWKGAVIYQIYPRSFHDHNGDGIGDLRGCIEKLDHCASLGVDAVWLSPFFKSPMKDFGYDVEDYYDIDPIFGTLKDFDQLVARAHALNLKVIIDQVYSHTSDQCAWFKESRLDRTNAKSDWYVWADPRPDGAPPNNWQSVFGGASWQWDNTRRQYYFHNFLSSQPDLNLHNPEVQDALLAVARFWLDRGVDGFRLDALNFGMHDPQLRDNPPAKVFKRPPTRPFDFQAHTYNQSHPDIVKFLERVRSLTDEYDSRFTVAEVGGDEPLDEMKDFTQGETRLNSAYSFDYLYAPTITPEIVRESSANWPDVDGEGWPSWAFSNHDAPRAITRWAQGRPKDDVAKLNLMMLMCLRGNVFIYQGEELGLAQADVPFENLQDPEAIANWPETLGRDGARTPMPWAQSKPNAGFTTGTPWLPVDRRHYADAVDHQEADEGSVLHFARKAIAVRKAHDALVTGKIEFLSSDENLLAFRRKTANEEMLCVFNLGTKPVNWQDVASTHHWRVVLSSGIDQGHGDRLPPALPLKGAAGFVAIREGN